MNFLLRYSLLLTYFILPVFACAADPAEHSLLDPSLPVQAHIDAFAKAGSDRSLEGTELFMPIGWDGRILTFGDLRFLADDNDGQEFNAGFGMRRVSEDKDYILGTYGFIDRRRSDAGNMFTQSTLGAEFLKKDWDLRLNAYTPLTSAKTQSVASGTSSSIAFTGTELQASINSGISRETPLYGADFEAGYQLPFMKHTWIDDTRVYAGVYHFDAPHADAMDGTRMRLEASHHEWLRFEAEAQNDNIRGHSNLFEARLRIPLDFWNGIDRSEQRPQGIDSRLDTRVMRDVDVVTNVKSITKTTLAPVLNSTTGTAQKIYVVDNLAAAGGDGSAQHPFSNLAAAQATSVANDIIYVRAGDGTSTGMSNGVTLSHDGERLIGSGVDLVYNSSYMHIAGLPSSMFNNTVIATATTAPLITNSAGDGINISNANAVEVAGINVSGASASGIVALNTANLLLRNIATTGNALDGIRIEADGAGQNINNVRLDDIVALGNRNGIRLYAHDDASLNAGVENSATIGNLQHGIIVYDDSAAGSLTADLGGGAMHSAGGNAIYGNGLESLTVDVDGSTVSAKNNWWGQAGGPLATDIYRGAPIDDGLTLDWTFTDGTLRDRSGNGNAGTLGNGATISGGNAIFNGATFSYALAPDINATDNGTALTVLMNMTPTSIFPVQTFIGKWDYSQTIYDSSWGIRATNTDGTNFFVFLAGPSDPGVNYFATSNANLTAGTPTNIGFVYNGTGTTDADRLKVYGDGTQLSGSFGGTIGTTLTNGNEPIRVAYPLVNSPAFAQPYTGSMGDVRIYDRALSADEVDQVARMNTTSGVDASASLSAAP